MFGQFPEQAGKESRLKGGSEVDLLTTELRIMLTRRRIPVRKIMKRSMPIPLYDLSRRSALTLREGHFQIEYAGIAFLFNIESALFKHVEHWLIFDQNLSRETQ
jgi:hypothetical protein